MTTKMMKLVAGAAMVAAGILNVEASSRCVTSLNGPGWRFSKDDAGDMKAEVVAAPGFDDCAWKSVEVPHDWAIPGPFNPEGDSHPTGIDKLKDDKVNWRGVGWYRRAFDVSEETMASVRAGAALWLEFDGVMSRSDVYVNGRRAGGGVYGYVGFRVDAAPFVRAGRNTLAVRADTRMLVSYWNPGPGISHGVRLVSAPAVHVAPGTAFVTTPSVAKDRATVRVAFAVTNRLASAQDVEVGVTLADTNGVAVAGASARAAKRVGAHGCAEVSFDLEVEEPRLWDVADPQLYLATVEAKAGGAADAQRVRFGIRAFEFTVDDGFHLNGRRVQLTGVDQHSETGLLGAIFNRSIMLRQLLVLKDMGVNAIRTCHNPWDPHALDLCDELGIVVIDEGFNRWDRTAGRTPDENLEAYVTPIYQALVRRDRNHPCVVAWSLGNEIPPAGYNFDCRPDPAWPDGVSKERIHLFREAIRALDKTRPVTLGNCHLILIGMGLLEELDMTGWHYNARYREMKAKYPDKPLVYDETSCSISSSGFFEDSPVASPYAYSIDEREVSGYAHCSPPWGDVSDLEFKRVEEDKYIAGELAWAGTDYMGNPDPYQYCETYEGFSYGRTREAGLKRNELQRSSFFGITDLLCLPKSRFWLYRSHWNKKAHTVKVTPHWTWDRKRPVAVYVYTDGDEAELFVNGVSQGRRRKGEPQPRSWFREGDSRANPYYDVLDTYRLRWFDVTYEPGELKVVAYKNGEKIGEDVVRTAGEPVRVKLTPEATTLPADGETCVFVQVDVVDAKGERHPRASNRVFFTIRGPGKIMAVGNADPRCMESFDASSYPLYYGKAAVIVRRDKGSTAPITLTASVIGLDPDTVTFK